MRQIGDVSHPACKITLFAWNQKFLVKVEQGLCEQTFKLPELDFNGTAEDLRGRLSEQFLNRVLARFAAMNEDVEELLG